MHGSGRYHLGQSADGYRYQSHHGLIGASMPITLAKIANNTAQVTLHIGEDSVAITYYPARITEKTLAQLQLFIEANEENLADSFAGLNSILTTLIQSWEVFEDDAQ